MFKKTKQKNNLECHSQIRSQKYLIITQGTQDPEMQSDQDLAQVGGHEGHLAESLTFTKGPNFGCLRSSPNEVKIYQHHIFGEC